MWMHTYMHTPNIFLYLVWTKFSKMELVIWKNLTIAQNVQEKNKNHAYTRHFWKNKFSYLVDYLQICWLEFGLLNIYLWTNFSESNWIYTSLTVYSKFTLNGAYKISWISKLSLWIYLQNNNDVCLILYI